jgi:hypothetical protein
MKRARQEKARVARTAANRSRLQANGKSRYAQKRARHARGNFNPTSPFYVAPGTEAQEEGRLGRDDGLDLLVSRGLCSERTRDELRGFGPRFEREEWS